MSANLVKPALKGKQTVDYIAISSDTRDVMLVQRLLSSGRQQILRGISFKQLKLTTPGFRYISSTRELPDKKPLKIGRLDKSTCMATYGRR